MASAATISDIAQAAGVSHMTVSRVLNGKADYRRPTFARRAERIHQLAREMGYRPNASAMAIRTGRFDMIALLLSADRKWSMLPDQLLAGIRQALTAHDLHLMVEAMSDDVLTSEAVVPKLLRQLTCDGLLINYNANIPPEMTRLINSYKLPSIWINSKQPNDAVHPDDFGAAEWATRILLERGHRRIGLADFTNAGPATHYSATDRFEGYRTAMAAAGLTAQRVGHPALLEAGELIPFLVSVLKAPDRPTALISYNAEDVAPLQLAAAVAGIRIPDDLSLIAFDDRVQCKTGVRVATMLLPEQQEGLEAVEMLLQKIEQPELLLKSRPLPFTFDSGGTVADAPPPSC